MDKIVSKEIFIKRNIPTASFIVYEKKEYTPQSLAHLAKTINFPIVVKPYFAGSSVGVFVVRKPGDFKEAVESAFAVQSKLILEDYIEGRELTVGILEETALSVVEIKPKNDYFDFKTKYSDGLAQFIAPADLGSMLYGEIQAIALAAHRALGCRFFSRVDIRLSTANIAYVLEVNSIPGLTSHSLLPLSAKCCGISFDDLILKMAHLALNEKKQIQKTGKD
jgi:D-alanine-D-alanine ligase